MFSPGAKRNSTTGVNEQIIADIVNYAFSVNSSGLTAILKNPACKGDEVCKAVAVLCELNNDDAHSFLHNHLRFHPGYLNRAVEMYAKLGKVSIVEDLLAHFGADINSAICGYAYSALWFRVNALLARGGEKGAAIYAYAFAGLTHLVENLMENDIKTYLYQVELGYKQGGHFDFEAGYLRILSLTSHAEFRKTLAYPLMGEKPEIARLLLEKAGKMHVMMKEYQLSFSQCDALYDEITAIETKYGPGFFGRLFSTDASESRSKILAEVLELMTKFDNNKSTAGLVNQ